MPQDYRMNFIRDVETALAFRYEPDEIAQISNVVIKALSEYEIAERCTDLVPQDDINEKLIRRYTACLLVDGKSKNTVKQYARTAQKLSDLIRKPFTEMGALRSACKTVRERALVEFLVSTGLRVSELTGMKIEDVNFNTLSVHVVSGKGDKDRMTYTTQVAAKHLISYLRGRKKESVMLFCNRDGGRISTTLIQRVLKQLGKRAGVDDVHPHRFRRTFATNLSKRGMEIQEIQKLLGHSNVNTTMIYVNTDDSMIRASYNRYTA